MISSRFRNCLLDVRNKRDGDIGLENDLHLMIAYIRLGSLEFATSRRLGELRPPKININSLYNPAALVVDEYSEKPI